MSELWELGKWLPSIVLAILLAIGLTTGAGLESLVAVALLVIQALVLAVPWAAKKAGAAIGDSA